MKRLEEGLAYSRNPLFKNKVTKMDLTPENVDCIVFCSKNYKPLLPHLEWIEERYNTFYHYTITAYGKEITLERHLKTFEYMAEKLAPYVNRYKRDQRVKAHWSFLCFECIVL